MLLSRLAFVAVPLVAACDVFTARVPCAVDDECGDREACVDGFCAEGTRRDESEGEGEAGEGEGERPVESHPLRGSVCNDPAAPSISDSALRCSVFGVFEEPCDDDLDCGDPAAPFCVDPGAGPAICAATADFTRSACPDDPSDPDVVVDGNVDVPFGCLDGSLSYVPSLRCETTAVAYSGPQLLGGDLTVRLNNHDDDANFCDTLELVSFGSTHIGGSVHIGVDGDGAQPTNLTAIPFRDLIAIDGDYVLERTQHITTPALGSVRRVLGDLVLRDNAAVESINFYDLVEVGGDVIIENNTVLAAIVNTEPTQIGGNLVVRGSPQLTCDMVRPLIDVTLGNVTVDVGAPCP